MELDESKYPMWMVYLGFVYLIMLMAALILIPPVVYSDETLLALSFIYWPIPVFVLHVAGRPNAPRLMRALFAVLCFIAMLVSAVFSSLFLG